MVKEFGQMSVKPAALVNIVNRLCPTPLPQHWSVSWKTLSTEAVAAFLSLSPVRSVFNASL